MLPEKNVSFGEFVKGIKELGFTLHFRFRRSQSGDLTEHDWVFIVNTYPPHEGAHLGSLCLCCVGSASINDYQNYEDSFDLQTYDAVLDLLFNFTYTATSDKEIDS